MTAPQRRTLKFETLDAMLEDARQVVTHPHVTVGNWTEGQILDHLTRTIDCGFDGFGFQAPLWIRLFIKPFRNSVLVKPMKSGYRLPQQAVNLQPESDVPSDEALSRFESSVERLKTEDPLQLHPFMGRLTPVEYRLLNLRHGELHLSFIVPTQ